MSDNLIGTTSVSPHVSDLDAAAPLYGGTAVCDVGFSYVSFAGGADVVFGPGVLTAASSGPPVLSATDYSLEATSPCIDRGAGSWSGLNAPATDILGQLRPRGLGWDLGAFERQVAAPPLEVLACANGGSGVTSITAATVG